MENMIYCQSCGMPMTAPEHFGTEKDGSPSKDYCVYCYKDGAFTQQCTMDEMIEHNLQFLAEFNKDSATQYSPEQARAEMQQYFPTLKRWAKK
jgi:radical SAM superfamily enzyme